MSILVVEPVQPPRTSGGRAAAFFGAMWRLSVIAFWSLGSFLHLVLGMPIAWLIGVRRGVRASSRHHVAVVLRVWLQNLGATFIKVGQIISSRPDVVPPWIIEQLVRLQDQVPPFSFSAARRVIERSLGRPLESMFARFEPIPVAAASVAQVHAAWLADGTKVAVKVRRPRVVEVARFDEAIMVAFARIAVKLPSVDLLAPIETVHEFCSAVRDQLDLRREACNNAEFQRQFRDDPNVVFPHVYEELSSDAVLTMGFIEGVRATEVPADERAAYARIGVDAVLRMVYRYGFIHADLHPGNIFFLPNRRIGVLDLGLVARIDDMRREALATVVLALAQGDGRIVARFMYEGSARKDVRDYPAFERDVSELVGRTRGKSMGEFEISIFMGSIFDILRRHRIRADPAFTTVNVAMLVSEGLAKQLDPTFQLFTYVQPYLIEIVASSSEAVKRVAAAAAEALGPPS